MVVRKHEPIGLNLPLGYIKFPLQVHLIAVFAILISFNVFRGKINNGPLELELFVIM